MLECDNIHILQLFNDGIDDSGLASYILRLYYSLADLADDAIAMLQNVEVGYYDDSK